MRRRAHYISHALLQGIRFGLSPFRSPLLRGSLLISPPLATQMLPFARFTIGSLLTRLPRYYPGSEVSFGYPRIEDRLRLPEAYRSLPRPSSSPKPSHPPDGVVAPIGSDTLRLAHSYTWR